jgi:hypothetical protein
MRKNLLMLLMIAKQDKACLHVKEVENCSNTFTASL